MTNFEGRKPSRSGSGKPVLGTSAVNGREHVNGRVFSDMTAERFLECLEVLDWSIRGFADTINVSERQARRWATGFYPLPVELAAWLDKLARFHEANPRPATPERRKPGPQPERREPGRRPAGFIDG